MEMTDELAPDAIGPFQAVPGTEARVGRTYIPLLRDTFCHFTAVLCNLGQTLR